MPGTALRHAFLKKVLSAKNCPQTWFFLKKKVKCQKWPFLANFGRFGLFWRLISEKFFFGFVVCDEFFLSFQHFDLSYTRMCVRGPKIDKKKLKI